MIVINTSIAGRARRLLANRAASLSSGASALTIALVTAGHAFAAAPAAPGGGIGEQMNLLSSEGMNASATAFTTACYVAAAVAFFGGVWAAWQSRQPNNRDSGYVTRAVAGLVLCGLFATAGVWINKASVSASGGAASITDSTGMVAFGAGAGAG